MADMARDTYRIAPLVGAGTGSWLSVMVNTVMGLLGMGSGSTATQAGARITPVDGAVVAEIASGDLPGANGVYPLVEASWSTMTAEEFEARWISGSAP